MATSKPTGNPPASKSLPARSQPPEIKRSGAEIAVFPTGTQQELCLVEKQTEYEGIEMGVLESGVPYLSGRGLAHMCGIEHAALHEMATNWHHERLKPRGRQIELLLRKSGYTETSLFLNSQHNGRAVNAYPEPVCIALLEFYAFVSHERKEEAQFNFRNLARVKFREYVYQAVGYSPEQKILDSWKHFHDRVNLTMDAVPEGYFGVFREIASIIVPMITAGVMVNDKLVPDISVGIAWSNHWKTNNLESQFGERVHYEHNHPDYYPQCKSNPQPSHAYPDAALGEFKKWLRQTYLKTKFQPYMIGQIKKGSVHAPTATLAVLALTAGKQSAQRPALR